MDSLPPELLSFIFQKLPTKEVYRLRRVSKSIAALIDSRPMEFPRPRLSIAVGQAPDDKFVRKCGMVTITTLMTTFRLVIDERDNLELVQIGNASKDFMLPFYDYAEQHAPATQKSLFMKWVFAKADLENFEIIPYENWHDLATWVSRELKESGAHCETILMRHDYRLFNPFRANTWVFFPQLCEERRQLGAPLKLHVHPKVYDDILVAPNHPEYLHVYCQWFSDVLFTFSYKMFFAPLFAIATRWIDQELEAINYRIRFEFNTTVVQNLQILAEDYKQKFLDLELFLDDINDLDLNSYIGPNAYERIPEKIEVSQNQGRGYLLFKFTKVEKYVYLTLEYN